MKEEVKVKGEGEGPRTLREWIRICRREGVTFRYGGVAMRRGKIVKDA